MNSSLVKLSVCHIPYQTTNNNRQGRIYVANEYPTFERIMLMVGQKTYIFVPNYLECKTKSVCFNEKNANFRVKHTNCWIFQHPTVGSQKFNTLHVGGRDT